MADNTDGQNLDLAQILATLANLPRPQEASSEIPQQPYTPVQDVSHNPAAYNPTHPSIPHRYDQPQDLTPKVRPPAAALPPSIPQRQSSTPPINPATITEWKHGLRCVNKIAAMNPDFPNAVRKLMKDQERNFKDWEAGRKRLIDEQKFKKENEEMHRAALSGILGSSAPLRTPEREHEELTTYDLKVYRACRLMVDSQSASLKGLGVPFFGVRPDLVVPDDSSQVEEGAGESKKITKKQLLELQRKMLNHLMEMYGD